MTAADRIRATQRGLVVVATLRALGWAGGVLFAALIAGTTLAGLAPLPAFIRANLPWLAVLLGVATAGAIAWRARFVWSRRRVALWVEECAPDLRYALVTAMDPRYAATLGPVLESVVAQVDTRAFVRHAARRSLLPALAAFVVTGGAFVAVPPAWKAAGLAGAHVPGGSDLPSAGVMRSRLTPLHGTLTPPAYAAEVGVPVQTLHEPTTIKGLAGSRVVLSGPGAADGIKVRVGGATSVPVTGAAPALDSADSGSDTTHGVQWTVTFTLPDSAMALRFTDRHYHRLIVLDPQRDASPTVQLLRPVRDTTVRSPNSGSLTLHARFADDLGLSAARFEYIVSSGESEGSFTSRQGTLGARTFRRTAGGELRLTVPLRTLQLTPGGQLSVRAVAIDNNTLTGPDTGYSEPRILRVARPGEYDSLAVEGAPPPADTAVATLRYIIQLTEELEKARPRLPRPTFVARSQDLGHRVERLRARVQQLQNDHTLGGLLEPDTLLSEAYLALVQGGSALLVAEPGEALPHLWKALEALQQFAQAERYYLRGTSPEVLVNLARVRLTGTDTGYATPRTPRPLADTMRTRLWREYTHAVQQLAVSPDSAVERLLALEVDALRSDPPLATVLGEAIAALRAGRDATRPLSAARRLLDGRAHVVDTLPRWSGVW